MLSVGEKNIERIGVQQAINRLKPYVRQAGRLALRLQPQISEQKDLQEKGGSRQASAITDADFLVQDRIGSDVAVLFSDASFYGEERTGDRISRYLPNDRPYIITCDPVNGTLQYRDGLPHFEVILTICSRDWEILGTMIYVPAMDLLFSAFPPRSPNALMATRERWNPRSNDHGSSVCVEFKFSSFKSAKHTNIVYLGTDFTENDADTLRRAGYEPVFANRHYTGQADWPHTSLNILKMMSPCVGAIKRNAQLIDNGALGFTVAKAGGFWQHGKFDPTTLKYEYSAMARDQKTLKLLMSLL